MIKTFRKVVAHSYKLKNKMQLLTKMKKGEAGLDDLGKLLLALALLAVVAGFIYLAKDKIVNSLHNFFSGGIL